LIERTSKNLKAPLRSSPGEAFFAFQHPIDEIKVILCQLMGLFDQNSCPISFFKRKRFVGLALTHLISYIKQLLSLIAQPIFDLDYSLSRVEVFLW